MLIALAGVEMETEERCRPNLQVIDIKKQYVAKKRYVVMYK